MSRRPVLHPLFCLCVGRLTLLRFPPPPFFSDKPGRLAFQKKERVKLYTQLKSVQSQQPEHPGTTNYYCCLTHTDIQESLIIKINRSYSIAISFILTAPIQQTVQDNAPMLACPSRAAKPIHPTRLYDQLMRYTNQTEKFLLLH